MTLSDFSIKRPVFAWTLMAALIFFGMLSFRQMGINENPDVEFPVITIRYAYEGATPEVIEKDVIEPVESVLVSMEGIRNLASEADRGSADIKLEFELDVDIDLALQEVNTLLSRAQRELPDSLDPPVVTKSNADDDPIIYVTIVTSTLSQRELMILFRDRVRDRLSIVEGVAEIRAFGYHEPMLRVDLDAEKLKQYQLTANDIVASIQREHQELPAGKLEYKDTEDLIRIMGEVNEVEEFENLIISRRGGAPNYRPILLKDVAHVYEGIENLRRISRVNGTTALGIAVQKQRGVNAVKTADRVIEKLDEINAILPEGTEISVNFDRTQYIRESVDELVFTLVLSALLTSLVCWIFIGSWSATVNILLAIPTAVIGTFILIHWFGFTLNTFSLLGLALAVGVIVDDAIVMLENIARYMERGFDRVNAAFKGAREITFAVLATTVALVSIFIPITFMEGIEGRFFFEFAVTLSIAVAISSLEALTLAPMRSSQFLTVKKRTTWFGKMMDGLMELHRIVYRRILSFVLQNRIWTTLVVAALFVASLGIFRILPSEFVPAQDRGALFLIFQAPEGKSLEYTLSKVKEFENFALKHPDVKRVFTAVGGFGQGGQGNRGNGIVILKDPQERKSGQFQIATELRDSAATIDGIRIFIRDRFGSNIGGRRGSPIEFTISGPDPERQRELYDQFKERMEKDPAIVGTRSDDVLTIPEVHIVPNRDKAIRSGVEVGEIATVVNATFGGIVAGQYTKGSRRFDIYVQLKEKDRQKKEDIRPVLVRNNRGEILSLSEVVDVIETEGPQQIFREDRIRGIRVDASLAEGARLGPVVEQIQKWASDILPDRYFIRFSETPQEKILMFIYIMSLGLIIAYMILASQFNSFVDPFIVFLAIPFSITGSGFALWITGQSLNVYSVIGILLTMGIVKKNSILMVEFTNQLRDQGYQVNEALKAACDIRLRPILMTNIATIAAAIPAAMAIGPGSETRIPMALTVIGGVVVSLPMTLLIVPAVYSLISPKRIKVLEETDSREISAA